MTKVFDKSQQQEQQRQQFIYTVWQNLRSTLAAEVERMRKERRPKTFRYF